MFEQFQLDTDASDKYATDVLNEAMHGLDGFKKPRPAETVVDKLPVGWAWRGYRMVKVQHCTYADCKSAHWAKGLCKQHYVQRWYRLRKKNLTAFRSAI